LGAFSGPETEGKDLLERVDEGEELQRRVSIALGKSSQKVKECLKAAGQRNGTEENMGEEQRWVDGCSGRIKEWKPARQRRGAQCGASVRIWGEGGQPPSEREGK
jgi:hypothetical protein